MKGVNDKPGTPNYDMYQKALRSTAQRLYPNYANCNWSAQMNWYKKDREDKQKFIDNMSNEDQNMLIEMLEKYPEYRDILGLDIINE
jgi:ribonucleoside-triphosphate reductase